MNPTHPERLRFGVLIAAALLVAEGVWSLQLAADDFSPLLGAFGVGAFLAALGLLKTQPWSRFYVYAAAALLIVACTRYTGSAVMLGEFDALPLTSVGASLAPVLALCVLSIWSAEVVRRYFRTLSGSSHTANVACPGEETPPAGGVPSRF